MKVLIAILIITTIISVVIWNELRYAPPRGTFPERNFPIWSLAQFILSYNIGGYFIYKLVQGLREGKGNARD